MGRSQQDKEMSRQAEEIMARAIAMGKSPDLAKRIAEYLEDVDVHAAQGSACGGGACGGGPTPGGSCGGGACGGGYNKLHRPYDKQTVPAPLRDSSA